MSTISSFFGLETALRGLRAQQAGLNVASHNVANANTPGYSRQRAVTEASSALQLGTPGGLASLGTGVDVQAYARVRDKFLDLQYRVQTGTLGQSSTMSAALAQVETALGEPGDTGIAAQLAKFWSAWGDVANNPSNPAARKRWYRSRARSASCSTVSTGSSAISPRRPVPSTRA